MRRIVTRTSLAAGLIGMPLAASAQASAAATGQQAKAIEGVVTALFTALRHSDYQAACSDYTPDVQDLVVLAATKLMHKKFTTCGSALAAIYRLTPSSASEFHHLGAPHYSDLKVDGRKATVTYTSTIGKLVAHSAIDVDYQSGRWLVGRATSLTFTKR